MFRRSSILSLAFLFALAVASLAACGGEYDITQDEIAQDEQSLGGLLPLDNQTFGEDGNYGDDDGIPNLTAAEYAGCCEDSGCTHINNNSYLARCDCVGGNSLKKAAWASVQMSKCVADELLD